MRQAWRRRAVGFQLEGGSRREGLSLIVTACDYDVYLHAVPECPTVRRGCWTLFVAGHMLADNFHFLFRFHFVEKPRGAQLSTAIHALVFCEEGLCKCDNLT